MENYFDFLYKQMNLHENSESVAMDSCECLSLREHDKMFHGGKYEKGTKCRLREAMKRISRDDEKSSWKNPHLRRTSMTPPLHIEKWEKKPELIDGKWVSKIPVKLLKTEPGDSSFANEIKTAVIKAKDRIEELKAYDSSGQVKRIVYGVAIAIENYEMAIKQMTEMAKNAPQHIDNGCC